MLRRVFAIRAANFSVLRNAYTPITLPRTFATKTKKSLSKPPKQKSSQREVLQKLKSAFQSDKKEKKLKVAEADEEEDIDEEEEDTFTRDWDKEEDDDFYTSVDDVFADETPAFRKEFEDWFAENYPEKTWEEFLKEYNEEELSMKSKRNLKIKQASLRASSPMNFFDTERPKRISDCHTEAVNEMRTRLEIASPEERESMRNEFKTTSQRLQQIKKMSETQRGTKPQWLNLTHANTTTKTKTITSPKRNNSESSNEDTPANRGLSAAEMNQLKARIQSKYLQKDTPTKTAKETADLLDMIPEDVLPESGSSNAGQSSTRPSTSTSRVTSHVKRPPSSRQKRHYSTARPRKPLSNDLEDDFDSEEFKFLNKHERRIEKQKAKIFKNLMRDIEMSQLESQQQQQQQSNVKEVVKPIEGEVVLDSFDCIEDVEAPLEEQRLSPQPYAPMKPQSIDIRDAVALFSGEQPTSALQRQQQQNYIPSMLMAMLRNQKTGQPAAASPEAKPPKPQLITSRILDTRVHVLKAKQPKHKQAQKTKPKYRLEYTTVRELQSSEHLALIGNPVDQKNIDAIRKLTAEGGPLHGKWLLEEDDKRNRKTLYIQKTPSRATVIHITSIPAVQHEPVEEPRKRKQKRGSRQ